MVGPMTMRRVEKMPGSKVSVEVLDPVMSKNPMTIMAPAIAMRIKLIFTKGISRRLCVSSVAFGAAVVRRVDVELIYFILEILMEHVVIAAAQVTVGGHKCRN